jgi:hypothetical protein
MTSTHKLFAFTVIALVTAVVIITIYMGLPSLSWLGELLPESPVMIMIWAAIPIVALVYAISIKGQWKAKDPKGAMFVGTMTAALAFILLALVLVFGTNAVERGFQDIRQMGEDFANRVPEQNTTTPTSVSARDLLCGPSANVGQYLTSTTVPVRFHGRDDCLFFAATKTIGIPVRISINGGRYLDWVSGSPPPFIGGVDYMDALLVSPGRAHMTIRYHNM